MQLPTNYLIKVNQAKTTAILDFLSGQVADNAKEIVSDSNNGIKLRIGWLSCVGTGKLYRSIVVCLAEKKDTELFQLPKV